jgi:hypothetical protein
VFASDPELARGVIDEQSLRDACALPGVRWEYLRFVRDSDDSSWRPAAGTFPDWPKNAAEITYCDPCCGSGHFLVEAFTILSALREREEGLTGEMLVCKVLQENLHGLELDGRCVQIAAFNVALMAWKIAGGPANLPQPQIAWVGAPPPMSKLEMASLGGDDIALSQAFAGLHDQFVQAPILGSLLEIGARDLLDVDLRTHGFEALKSLGSKKAETEEGVIAARGLFGAVDLLARDYVLIGTNVPFRSSSTLNHQLKSYIETKYSLGKRNLATAMFQRLVNWKQGRATVACVTPKEWLSSARYQGLREWCLRNTNFFMIAALGPNAFETITGEVVNVALLIQEKTPNRYVEKISYLDAVNMDSPAKKDETIKDGGVSYLTISGINSHPSAEIVDRDQAVKLLNEYVRPHQGLATGDLARFSRFFWEVPEVETKWELWQGGVKTSTLFGGSEKILLWENGKGQLHTFNEENKAVRKNTHLRGLGILGCTGVLVTQMGGLPVSLYSGERYDDTTTVLVPKNEDELLAIWCFLESPLYGRAVRRIDSSIKVPAATLAKVNFDLEYWRSYAEEAYPDGLPSPYSSDPKQWLFHGHPAHADEGTELLVALALAAGYRWPAMTSERIVLSEEGQRLAATVNAFVPVARDLLPLHATSTEKALVERVRGILTSAFGTALGTESEARLVRAADLKLDKKEARDVTLETWLRERAFRQHCVLFEQRPFLWHVWDNVRDGFSVFINYHQLNQAALERLTFTVLGDWIAKARAEARTAHEDRALQLQQRLKAVIEGEGPYDIFVRWKPLERQPVGWHPDIDDGVRINIRPFVLAEILRDQPRINWSRDRGADPATAPWYYLGPDYGGKLSDRINDHHLTLAEKRAARAKSS